MIEYTLTQPQKIRLEALAQALAANRGLTEGAGATIERAKVFEAYINPLLEKNTEIANP